MNAFLGNPALDAWLSDALKVGQATVERAEKLSGGAIQESWSLEVRADGSPRALVLRRDAQDTITASLSRLEEFEVLKAAWAAGVAVPRPVAFCRDETVAGKPFALAERMPGVGYGPRIVRDLKLGGDRSALGREIGRQLARIHAIAPDAGLARVLGPKPADPALAEVALQRQRLDAMGERRPGLEWALRWAERNAPPPSEVVLTHQDYRTGNILVDDKGLTAILDWEFASWSDPMSDLGWFCAECWRFSRPDLEAGGLCDRDAFYDGYTTESGRAIDPRRVRWWEVMAHLRWAVIALQQGRRRAAGSESLNLILTGRIAEPLELAVLRMTGPQDAGPLTARPPAPAGPSGDADMLALLDGAASLLRETAPDLPGDGRYVALLSANAVAMARRGMAMGDRIRAARAAVDADAGAIRAGDHDGDAPLYGRLVADAALRAFVTDPGAVTPAESAAFVEGWK
ncbi:phosphotransferase family protein [Paracoccus sediminis]|uniref:Phosphotransferase family protein n=1 Tax=Paracoccus sediminis TaxID=1214787 RepID=A0A238YFW4_9RHOB|nr:phosphotransferase family protein [Paracoccus sediminis]TBN46643.1 phosphotransferase family protein [Paracoccus sediminis]SNR70136.1 Predicted kinase, aminoglycoside phosphotransferase (APT) family [Paracoccus sediminis]